VDREARVPRPPQREAYLVGELPLKPGADLAALEGDLAVADEDGQDIIDPDRAALKPWGRV